MLKAARPREAMRRNSVSQGRIRGRRDYASLASVSPQGGGKSWRGSPLGEQVPGGEAVDCPPARRAVSHHGTRPVP